MLLYKWLQTPSVQHPIFQSNWLQHHKSIWNRAYAAQVYTILNIHLHLVIKIAHKEQTNVHDVSSSVKDSASDRIMVLQSVKAKIYWMSHSTETEE